MKEYIRQRWHQFGVQGKLHIFIQGSLIVLFIISTNWVIERFEKQILAMPSNAPMKRRMA